MRLKEMWKRFIVMLLASTVIMTCVPAGTVFAEEAGEGEEAAGENAEEGGETEGEEGEEGAEGEGEMTPEEMQAALEVVKPSSIETNIDGKYLALAFPASSVPEGFSVFTVDYQGEKVMLAQMTSKSATLGAPGLTVTLAYLTDESGNNGEFYICDTTENARMSDMIMINGADDKYIIVLDPGDNVVGPPGFTQHKLQWGSKTAVAWSLPEDTVEEDSESSTEASEVDKVASLFVQKVYADELGLTAGEAAADPISAGAGNVDEAAGGITDDPADSGDEDQAKDVDEDAMIALDAIAHTNASGLIQAQPKEFCLLYAIDESANLGFYLYDIERGTYQRYVDIPKGESATLIKYKKLSRTRLFIIIIMAIIMVILVFIFINTLVNRRGDNDYDDDEEDPEEEAMRQRAKDKERKGIGKRERAYLLDEEPEEGEDDDFEDDYEDDDDEGDEDEDDYEEEREKKSIIKRRSVTQGKELPQKRAMAEIPVERNKAETEVDWENMEITAGLNPRKTKAVMDAAPKRTSPKKSTMDFDLDEDFDFEFINIKK